MSENNKIKFNIVFISPEITPYIGGIATATLGFAKALVKSGHSVSIVSRNLLKNEPLENISGVNIYRVPYIRTGVLHLDHLSFFFTAVSQIKKINKKKKIDILYGQTIISSGVISSYLAKKINAISIAHTRGGDIDVGLSSKIRAPLNHFVLSKANLLFSQTKVHAEKVQKFCGRMPLILQNGMSEKSDYNKTMTLVQLQNLKIDEKKFNLLFVGNLSSHKGLRFLIEALSQLPDSVILHILGKDRDNKGELDYINEYITTHSLGSRLFFHGQVSHDMVLDYMSYCDVLVLPSLREGMPNVVLEAMSMSLPVVASNLPTVQEIIVDGENGLLVELSNPKSIADKISCLVENKDYCKKIGIKGKKTVQKKYSWNVVVKNFESFVYSFL